MSQHPKNDPKTATQTEKAKIGKDELREQELEHTDTNNVLQQKDTNQEAQIARDSGELSASDLNTVAGGKPNITETVITKPTDTASNTPLTK